LPAKAQTDRPLERQLPRRFVPVKVAPGSRTRFAFGVFNSRIVDPAIAARAGSAASSSPAYSIRGRSRFVLPLPSDGNPPIGKAAQGTANVDVVNLVPVRMPK
jgi:hypothetical protein